jgi:hypothetical protein
MSHHSLILRPSPLKSTVRMPPLMDNGAASCHRPADSICLLGIRGAALQSWPLRAGETRLAKSQARKLNSSKSGCSSSFKFYTWVSGQAGVTQMLKIPLKKRAGCPPCIQLMSLPLTDPEDHHLVYRRQWQFKTWSHRVTMYLQLSFQSSVWPFSTCPLCSNTFPRPPGTGDYCGPLTLSFPSSSRLYITTANYDGRVHQWAEGRSLWFDVRTCVLWLCALHKQL